MNLSEEEKTVSAVRGASGRKKRTGSGLSLYRKGKDSKSTVRGLKARSSRRAKRKQCGILTEKEGGENYLERERRVAVYLDDQ